MRIHHNRAGTSLADLIISMAVLAVTLTIAAPRLISARDALAVRSARDAAVGELERARSLALAQGNARVTVDAVAARIAVEAPAGSPARDPLFFRDAFAVDVTVDGTVSGPVSIDFNAMGLGVTSNRTIRFRRGDQEARLSVSVYGRIRRW